MDVRLALFLHFSFSFCSSVFSFPLHASCKVEWNFSADCSDVQNRLVGVIKRWNGPDNCKGGGERCLYQLKSQSGTKITATHETPTKHYVDDLTFDFTKKAAGGCTVQGYSTSETWYALLDQGTNYCNLNNLITGADLDKDPQYSETTSDSQCTQYSKHDCDKY